MFPIIDILRWPYHQTLSHPDYFRKHCLARSKENKVCLVRMIAHLRIEDRHFTASSLHPFTDPRRGLDLNAPP